MPGLVGFANGYHIIGRAYGRYIISRDGITWSASLVPNDTGDPDSLSALTGIAFGRDTYVIVGPAGAVVQFDTLIPPVIIEKKAATGKKGNKR